MLSLILKFRVPKENSNIFVMNRKIQPALTVIVANIIVGNIILIHDNWNISLALGMTLACILVYTLFFGIVDVTRKKMLPVLFLSILLCSLIIILGNSFAMIIEKLRGNPNLDKVMCEFGYFIIASLITGLIGSLFLFPVVLGMGLMNFIIIFYFSKRKTS